MKIRTRVKIAGALVICVLLAYGALLLYLDRNMAQLVQEVSEYHDIVNKISILRSLTQDYLLYHTERAQRQWSAVYDEVLRLLDQREHWLLKREDGIGDAPQKLKIVGDTFARLMSLQSTAQPGNPEMEARSELQNRLTTQLLLATQDLLTHFLNLDEEVHHKFGKFERLSSILDMLALLLLGILLLSNAVLLQRAVVKPVLKLHAGAEIVGAGNLNYRVATTSKDEIGELSRAFDRMTANLKETTVSRDELVREMAERRQVEEALRESREDLNRAQAVAHVGSWRLNVRRNELTWSEENHRIFGIPSGTSMTYETFLDRLHPEDREYVDREWQAALRGEPYDIEHRIVLDGTVKWVRERAELEFDREGQLLGGFGTTQDITERRRAEEVLRESEERFRKVFENAATGIAITDWQGRFQQCNPAYCTLLGYTEEELRQMEFAALIHPEDRDKNLEKIQKLQAGELPFFEIENRYVRKDGQTVWVHKFVSILPDSTGKPAHILALVTDVTERRRAQAELAETLRQKEEALAQSKHLASFPQLNPNPVLEFDAQGRITYANQAAEEILEQLTPDLGLRDFLPGDWEEMQQGRERGENHFQREIRIKDKVFQGTIYFSESLGVWRIYAIDISQRHLAEEALRESEARFRSLFENMAEGVVVHELIYGDDGQAVDYRIVSANPAFEKHTGLQAADLQGQLASQAYGVPEAPYLEVYALVAQTGKPISFETFFPPLQRHFHISVTSPKKDFFVTVFEDITERRQMEERLREQTSELSRAVSDLEETNAELERFTYMISHDLKSPLVTIATFLGYLEEDLRASDAGRIDKDIHYIRTAADKMGQLLSELLEMSRIGRLLNPPVEVSFQEVAQEAVQTVAGPIAERGVAVQVGEEDVTLYGDRPRLVEIWQNLMENAVKYMGEQPAPRLSIGLERQGEETVFFVWDNGMGIDPQYHDKIFGIFEKLDPKSGGTGIGLAIVKRIVELYQGKIWVESAGLGQGACFRFTLPGAAKGEERRENS